MELLPGVDVRIVADRSRARLRSDMSEAVVIGVGIAALLVGLAAGF